MKLALGPDRAQLWPRWIWQLALIATIGAGLAMVQLLPTAELSPLSIRTQVSHWERDPGQSPLVSMDAVSFPTISEASTAFPICAPLTQPSTTIFLTVPGCLLALVGLIEMARRKNFFWLGSSCFVRSWRWGRWLSYRVPLPRSDSQPVPARAHVFRFGQLRPLSYGSHGDANTMGSSRQKYYRTFLPPALMSLFCWQSCLGLDFSLRRACLAGFTCCWFLRCLPAWLLAPFTDRSRLACLNTE